MRRRLVRGYADGTDEIGRVTSGGQDTLSIHGEVERHIKDSSFVPVHGLDRDEPDHGAHGEEDLGVALSQHF